jgi:hypothetical protein
VFCSVPVDAGLLCKKAAVFGAAIKETQFYDLYAHITAHCTIDT